MCIILSVTPFYVLGDGPPSWWVWCLENKLYACLMIFFLSNTLEGQLISSGAFEISLNGILFVIIWQILWDNSVYGILSEKRKSLQKLWNRYFKGHICLRAFFKGLVKLRLSRLGLEASRGFTDSNNRHHH